MTSFNITIPPIRWLEAQWINNFDCRGPPSSLYLFDTFSPDDTQIYYSYSDFSYMSPIFLELNFREPYPYHYCASTRFVSNLPEATFCCVSSLNLDLSQSIQSGTDILTDSTVEEVLNYDSLLYKFSPESSNGYAYCTLSTSNNVINLFGFNSIAILNDGHCMKSENNSMSATCSQDGVLSLYLTSNCTLDRFDMQLSSTAEDGLFPNWGEFSAKMIVLGNSTYKSGWTTYRPYSKICSTRFSKYLDTCRRGRTNLSKFFGIRSFGLSNHFFSHLLWVPLLDWQTMDNSQD
jgi:hypothetical protein